MKRETAEEREERWEEVFKRAEMAGKTPGDKRPYEALGLDEQATQGESAHISLSLSLSLCVCVCICVCIGV